MPFSADIAVSNGDHSNDDLANDDANHSLPHRKASTHQRRSLLPVGNAYLVDSPKRNICPSSPDTSPRWQGSNIVVDPYAECDSNQ